MSLNDKIESVYAGTDYTNPYQTFEDALVALSAKASGFAFVDGTGGVPDTSVQDAIDAFDAAVVVLTDKITTLKDTHIANAETYWNGAFLSYKTIPASLLAADNIKAEVLAAEALPPVDPTLTFFYLGTASWNDTNLADYDSRVASADAILDTIVDGTVNTVGEVTTETTKINNANTIIDTLNTDFAALYGNEETVYQDAVKYLQSYAYVGQLEGNPDNDNIQDIGNKFSGNLP